MTIIIPPFPPIPADERNPAGSQESFRVPSEVQFALGYGCTEADARRGYLVDQVDYSPQELDISPVNPTRGGFLTRSPLATER